MTSTTGASRAVAIATALACGVVSIVLLLALPSLTAADADVAGALSSPGSVPWWCTALILVLQAAALMAIRARPRAALLTIAALSLALSVVGPGAAFTLTHLAVVVAVFLAAPRRAGRDLIVLLPLTAFAVAAGTLLNGLVSGISTMPAALGGALVQGVGTVAITALIALALAAQRTTREAQRNEVEALARERDAVARERDALVRATASEERAAMARELHDIAAHHLSGIALLAAAADRQIDTDPSAAHESIQQVRAQTREVLDDVRGVVGLLRAGSPAERSVENLATLPALVDDRAATGLPVGLEVLPRSGGAVLGDGIGPLAQLVAYRTIQEALSNAAQHAPGAACLVTVDDTADARLAVEIRNDAPAAASGAAGPGGFGLIGMRERADLVGAQLEVGPTAEDGWRVRLTLPRDAAGTTGPSGATR